MRSNEKFRERVEPTADDLDRAQQALEPARSALQPGASTATVASVTQALRTAGFAEGYGVGAADVVGVPADGVGVSIGFGSACIFGDVSAGVVTLTTGGVTNEGSCLPGIGGH